MRFFLGLGRYTLDLRHCRSIKDKRRIVKSIIDRVGNNKSMVIREVGDPDHWKSSKLAIICLSDSEHSAKRALARARGVMEAVGIDVTEEVHYIFSDSDVTESIVCQGE